MREPERERFLDMATPLDDCEGDDVTSMPEAAMISLARCFPSRMASPASDGGLGGWCGRGVGGGSGTSSTGRGLREIERLAAVWKG